MQFPNRKRKQILPPITEMAKNVVQSGIRATKHYIKTGSIKVSDAEIQRRLTICKSCPHYLKTKGRCALCGCFMNFKAKLASEHCPIGKW